MSNKVTYDNKGNKYDTYKGLDGLEHTYSTTNGKEYVTYEGIDGLEHTYSKNDGKEYVTYEGIDGLKHTYSKNGDETFTTYKGLDGLEHTYSNKGPEVAYPYHGPVTVRVYERSAHVTRKIHVIEALLATVAVLAAVKYLWWGVAMLILGILLAWGIQSSFPRLSYEGEKNPSYSWPIIMLAVYGMAFADLLITVDLPILCEDLIDYGVSGCMVVIVVVIAFMILGMVFRGMKNGQDVTSHYINV